VFDKTRIYITEKNHLSNRDAVPKVMQAVFGNLQLQTPESVFIHDLQQRLSAKDLPPCQLLLIDKRDNCIFAGDRGRGSIQELLHFACRQLWIAQRRHINGGCSRR